ncbi:MAG: putative DNA binding domain-containing protein [Campylobacterales bacterium]|nr:putative DNA binding domain-containing protein [Campylobacterales bacterium]
MNIKELINNGETKRLEFKAQLPKNEAIVKTIIAFSNTSGGKLIIGVRDDREIVGIEDDDIFELKDRVSSLIFDSCYPNILPEIYTLNIDNRLLLVIEVFRGNLLPYYLKSEGKNQGTYIRIGATNRQASFENIVELERQRRNIYNEFEKIGKSCDSKKLQNMKLIKEVNGRLMPSNALGIVLGKFDNVMIKCARFKGTTMEHFIDKKEFSGTLFEILEDAIKFLQNHLHLSATIEGLRRVEEYEIPLIALREIVLNAIIHRDYTRNSDIKIAIYDDMVEIISVGGFVNGLTIEEIGNGRSELRNKVVANLFKELQLIESWGSGLEKVRNSCEQQGITFALAEKGSFVEAVFERPKKAKSAEKPSETVGKVSEKYRKVSETYLNKRAK